MVISNRLFPYPVLAQDTDDYREGSFVVVPELVKDKETNNELAIRFDIQLNSRGLQKLINEDKAEFVIHIECSSTAYRDAIRTQSNEAGYLLPKNKVNYKVALLGMVVAKQDIHYYSDVALNHDYDEVDIHFAKGSILAYYNIEPLDINKQYEELATSENIFTVCRYDRQSEKEHNPVRFSLSNDRIVITVDDDIYHTFITLDKDRFKPMVTASFVFPALIYTLEYLRKDSNIEDYQASNWFIQFDKFYAKSGKSFFDVVESEKSILEIAQELLDNPIGCVFMNANQMLEG